MKLLRMDGGRTGVSRDGERIAEVASLAPGAPWQGLIERWPEARAELAQFAEGASRPLAEVALEPPLPNGAATRVFAIGANFACHLARVQSVIRGEPVSEEQARGMFAVPWGFHVLVDTVVGDGARIVPPRDAELVDYEAEVAAVVATGGRDLAPGAVAFWGVAPAVDFSLRDPHMGRGVPFDQGPLTWTLQKTFQTGTSIGPWIQTFDEVGPEPDVELVCRVNGELRQQEWTRAMIWSFAAVVSHLSRFVEIRPGDVVLSGTPKGTALELGADGPFLRAGDVVEVDVAGVGSLRNEVAAW